MKQINSKQFLDALSPPERAKAQQDIMELKKRIWERVMRPPPLLRGWCKTLRFYPEKTKLWLTN